MKSFSVIDVNNYSGMHGAVMRVTRVYTGDKVVGFELYSPEGADRLANYTAWIKAKPGEIVEIVRATWRVTWHPMPEVGKPDQGLLVFHKR